MDLVRPLGDKVPSQAGGGGELVHVSCIPQTPCHSNHALGTKKLSSNQCFVNVVVDFLQDSDDCNTGWAQRIHEGFKSTFYVGAGWPRPLVVTVVRTLSLTYVKIQMFVTRGRTRRSAPTRRCDIRQAGSICYSVAIGGRLRRAEFVSQAPHIQEEKAGYRAARWNVEWVGR